MAITEESRNDLYEGLTEALGKRRATTLMEHLPQGGWGDVATKNDLHLLRTELQAEIGGLRTELQAEIGGVRSEMNVRFAEVHATMDVGFAQMRAQFADLRTELHRTLRLHTLAMMAMTITLLGLMRYTA